MPGNWKSNEKGNKVLAQNGAVIATVFDKKDGTWGAIVNNEFLTETADSADAMMAKAEGLLAHDQKAMPECSPGWKEINAGGGYSKNTGDGGNVSVKQATSGAWYAIAKGGILKAGEKPAWFGMATEAMAFVDARL